jgi:hypothetical protein
MFKVYWICNECDAIHVTVSMHAEDAADIAYYIHGRTGATVITQHEDDPAPTELDFLKTFMIGLMRPETMRHVPEPSVN